MNYAYVTLLSSEDYLPAVLILNQNLKNVNSRYPLLVAVTENIYETVKPYLEAENILYKLIPFLEYTKETQDRWMKDWGTKYTLNICSKFLLFKFYEYDKLVYIDSDIIIYQNIDRLFMYPDGALYNDNGRPFIGLFTFIPQNHKADYYYILSNCCGIIESDVLEPLFFPFKSNVDYRIPFEYYVNITYDNLDDYDFQTIKVYHFCYKYKPWKYNSPEEYLKTFYDGFDEKKPYSENRKIIVEDYFDLYYYPLLNKYPELKNFN